MPEFDDAPREFDIAKPRSKWWRRKLNFSPWLWLVYTLLMVVVIFAGGGNWRAAYPLLAGLGLIVLLIAASIGWQLIVRHGFLTWRRLARSPAKAMSRGDAVGADRAFVAAVARARQFSPHDHRRGIMLLELTDYLKNLGRCSEAKAFFEESVEIFGREWQSSPVEYLIALNNQAVFLIDLQDFAGAQRILEKVLDLTLFWSKGGIKPAAPVYTVQSIELILHLNLVVLCMRVEELAPAADHLEEADALFGKFTNAQQRQWSDYYRGVRALLLHAQGRFTMAANELDTAKNPENLICMSVRAKLNMERRDFSQAEQLLRKCLEMEGKQGSVHRPELRDYVMDLAESLFGQSKYDEAFEALEEAQAITHDFLLPATSSWRKTLADWLHRAQHLGRTADIALLEADLQKMSAIPEQAITISPKLRITPARKKITK